MSVGPGDVGTSLISLYYTDDNTHSDSQIIASFVVQSRIGKWTRFSLKVTCDRVTLYYMCKQHDTVLVKRQPMELVFHPASILYVGQAGAVVKQPFEVSTKFVH